MMSLNDALGVLRDFGLNLSSQGSPVSWSMAGEIGGDVRIKIDLMESVELRGRPGPHDGKAWLYHCLGANWIIRTADDFRRHLHGLGYTTGGFMEATTDG